MHMLLETLRDLVRFLTIVNGACAIFALVAIGRHQTLILWDWMDQPGWRWWSSGNVFSFSLPEKFRPRRRQLIVLFLVFVATLAIQALLFWLYSLTATLAAC